MKIEVDLNDVFPGEDGFPPENFEESIRRQIIENLQSKLSAGLQKRIDYEISRVMGEKIEEFVKTRLPSLFESVMDEPYHKVNTYGGRSDKSTTMRQELVDAIISQMQYKNERYKSENNFFTLKINEMVEAQVAAFKDEFKKQIDQEFKEAAVKEAVKILHEKLGLK